MLYSVLMFAMAVLFIVFGVLIYKGNTNLIHDYHQTKVKDLAAYGKAFGKALFVFAAAPLLSGIISLFGSSETVVMIAVLVLIIGMGAGIGCIIAVQKKYNNGIF